MSGDPCLWHYWVVPLFPCSLSFLFCCHATCTLCASNYPHLIALTGFTCYTMTHLTHIPIWLIEYTCWLCSEWHILFCVLSIATLLYIIDFPLPPFYCQCWLFNVIPVRLLNSLAVPNHLSFGSPRFTLVWCLIWWFKMFPRLLFSFIIIPSTVLLISIYGILNPSLSPSLSLFFSSYSCPTFLPPFPLIPFFFSLLIFVPLLFICWLPPCPFLPSFPTPLPCSSTGSPGPSSAGVFPELRELFTLRPVAGSRDLPDGADALLVSGPHVGRQLPHRSSPPRGSAYFCLPQDPPPAQH